MGLIGKRKPLKRLASRVVVEHRGVEPLTSTMRMSRATNCANAPNLVSFVTVFYIGRSGHNFDRRALQSEEFVLPTVLMPHIGSRICRVSFLDFNVQRFGT